MDVFGTLRATGWGTIFALLCAGAPCRAADSPGIGKTSIVVATIQDLSGPAAESGRQMRDGLLMHIEQTNAQGGINGRRVRLVVEDSAGDGQRAAGAARRLAEEGVFAVLGQMGGAQNIAAMPTLFSHGVINFLPLTGAPEVYEPASKLKMAFWPSYPDQMRSAIPYLVAAKHLARPCVIYEDSEFGRDALRGVEDAAHRLGLTVQERIAVRRDGNDAAPAVARLKGVGCDLIVFGTNVHEAAQALTEARRIGLEAEFLGTSALYTASIRESGGRVVDGLYAVNTVSYPYADDASRLVRDWTDAYRTRFKEDPTVFAVYGYCIFDLFAKAATRAGPNLSTDTFDAAMESTTFPRDMFGSPEYHISAADRLGSRKVRISQIVKGRWTAITPLLEAPATH